MIVAMLVALLVAGVVVALVAVPAYRQGRDVLTPQGEQLVQSARERTVEVVDAAREKVGDLAEKLPIGTGESMPSGSSGSSGRSRSTRTSGVDVDLRGQTTDVGQHRA